MTTKKEISDRINKKTMDFLDKLVGRSTLGNTIQAIRLSREMTQKELAQQLDISPQQLSDIENERKGVSPSKAREFAEKLGHLPERFVQLVFEDMLVKSGMDWEVTVKRRKKTRAKKSTQRAVTR